MVDHHHGACIANWPDTLIYNQIKGRDGTGFFRDNALVRVDVRGNGQSIYYAEDENTGYPRANEAICSAIRIHLVDRDVDRINFLDRTGATFRAITGLDYRKLKLEGFRWRAAERPRSAADLRRPPAPVAEPAAETDALMGEDDAPAELLTAVPAPPNGP